MIIVRLKSSKSKKSSLKSTKINNSNKDDYNVNSSELIINDIEVKEKEEKEKEAELALGIDKLSLL